MEYDLTNEAKAWAGETFEKIKTKIFAQNQRMGQMIPYVPRNGRYSDLDAPDGINWWTNGFWAGILWQMYHATKEESYRITAENIEKRLDEALTGFEGLHHDVGFMWLHTSVANYRLTGNMDSRRRGLHAANLLAGRYNPSGRFIRAWNGDNAGWMIVDCLMNLPLLYWAGLETGDPRFAAIAREHADTSLRFSVRADGSCNHISILDPGTGQCLDNPGGQGFQPGSSWSRGHSWGIYGFALNYLHSGDAAYLSAAKQIAHYYISNLAVNDWLPLVDFRAPKEPVKLDSTSAMITCCGLLEIARHVEEYERALYLGAALRILRKCEAAFANWNADEDAIIGHGASSYHSTGFDSDAPIIYGDYFFVEAILRLLGKGFLIW